MFLKVEDIYYDFILFKRTTQCHDNKFHNIMCVFIYS